MPYGFKGTENLRRTRSVCLSGSTCNMAFVVWGEKQFRRNTRRINGIWYVILSQKNPCRLGRGGGGVGGCWRGLWKFTFLCGEKTGGRPLVLFVLLRNLLTSLNLLRFCRRLPYEASRTKPTFWTLFLLKLFKAKCWPKFYQSPLLPYKIGQKEVLWGAGCLE